MNSINEITDDEFVPFLQSLGVDTCKSFEWMLNDPDFAGVLKWIYHSLDHNNALTAREEYRYNEIKKKNALLTPEDLEAAVASIQEQYPGICLPGDQEYKEDVERDIQFQQERLAMLEKQEAVVKDLIQQNELIKDQLCLELTQLNAAHQQCKDDEAKAAEECTELALQVDTLTDGLIDVIADNLEVYASCKGNKDTAKRFITFSPLESYRQSQALLRSHHELYVSKHFGKKASSITEELRTAAMEAKNMELRLSDIAYAYIKSKAELSGEQAKLALVSNYNNVHPSQITSCLLEAQSTVELLEQEENIMEQEIRNGVEEFVKERTELAVDMAMVAALEVRQLIQNSLTHLVDVWQRAFALDRILYYSLRHELRTLEEFVQFASELRHYAIDEASAVATRIDSMNEIIAEHSTCSQKLETTNPLLQTLCTIVGLPPTSDASVLVKAYNELQGNLKELGENVLNGYRRKELALVEYKNSTKPLRDYVWSGCTKQAHCWDLTVASLSHSLKHQMEGVNRRVLEATEMFTRVKNGDKQNLRKLWQWFVTDPTRFLAVVKNCSF